MQYAKTQVAGHTCGRPFLIGSFKVEGFNRKSAYSEVEWATLNLGHTF